MRLVFYDLFLLFLVCLLLRCLLSLMLFLFFLFRFFFCFLFFLLSFCHFSRILRRIKSRFLRLGYNCIDLRDLLLFETVMLSCFNLFLDNLLFTSVILNAAVCIAYRRVCNSYFIFLWLLFLNLCRFLLWDRLLS